MSLSAKSRVGTGAPPPSLPSNLPTFLQRRPPPSLTNTQSSIPSAAAQPPPPPAAATYRPLSDDDDSDDDELRALKQEAAAAANSAKSRNLAQEEDELEETEEDIRRVAEDLSRETGMSYAEVRELLDEQRRERTRAAQSEPRGYDRVQPQPPSTEAITNDHHSGEGEEAGEELTQEERWRQQLAELVPNRNGHYHSPQQGKYNVDSDNEEFSLEALRAKKKKAAHDAVLGHLSTKRGDVEKPKSLSNTSSIHVKVYEAQMTRRREVQEEKAETKRQAELDAAKERRMKGIFANLQIAKKLKSETTVRGKEVSSNDTNATVD